LRYHPSVYYRAMEDAPLEQWPALLAAITDLHGSITGILRTWLDRRRPAKAPLADPRRALGHLLCNGVRFGKSADILAAGEGIETMLALKSVLPLLPMAAGLSANHLAALDLPPALRRLYVARDNDAAGIHAAERLRERAAGLDVRELVPVHGDFNLDPGVAPMNPPISPWRRRHARASRSSSSQPTVHDFCPNRLRHRSFRARQQRRPPAFHGGVFRNALRGQ
jgi:hypothetical protein